MNLTKILLKVFRRKHFELVKTSLILVTTVGAIVYALGLNHEKLYQDYELELNYGGDDGDLEQIEKLLALCLKISIVFIILFTILFLYFIFNENMIGILVITLVSTITLTSVSLFFTQHLVHTTYTEIIISIVEIVLGFIFAYFLKIESSRKINELNSLSLNFHYHSLNCY